VVAETGAEISSPEAASVTVSFEDRICVIALNTPKRLNAFNVEMHEALLSALARADESVETRVILLTGTGRAFSAGHDLSSIDELTLPSHMLAAWYNPLVLRLRTMAKPVVAAVNGVAAGGAANLVLACDIVLAARSAVFLQGFDKIGLVPDCGGTWFLPRLMGDARARAHVLLGDPISSEDAQAYGLIYRCVDDDALMPAARDIARRLANGPAGALAAAKLALNASWTASLQDQLGLELALQGNAERHADFAEGLVAFRQKRQPKFGGP
jgi:2-(1,2-epoxy-1,2-dihydrophenyl)acetyl-CoA isomerase